MHHANVVAAILMSVLSLCALQASASSPVELCPIASDRLNRSISYNKEVLRAPTNAAETHDLLTTVQTGSSEARNFAIMRLAMAGDLDTFRHLFDHADSTGLFIYASRYLNRDDSVCVDAELEHAIQQSLLDPVLGRSLVALLGNNYYRHIHTFEVLRDVPFQAAPGAADKYLAFGRAITATHLPDIEAAVLDHAQGFMPFDTPLKKRVLPGLHQHYAKFFAQRRYAQAVPYFRAVLTEASRDETVQSFQINYGMLRTVIQQALAAIGDTHAYALLIDELEVITSKPLDAFAASELQNLGKLFSSPSLPVEASAIVNPLENMLSTAQPAQYDYPMRRTVYPILAALNDAQGTALLINELRTCYSQTPPPNRPAVIAILFEALQSVQKLDIRSLLNIIDGMPVPDRRQVWRLAANQHDEPSLDFLLAELRHSTTTDAQQTLGKDATATLMKSLAVFTTVEDQQRIRASVDELFTEQRLDERAYIAAVTPLNKALGNESPIYTAFRTEQAQRKAAEKQARQARNQQQYRRQTRADYAADFSRQSRREGIAKNIAILASNNEQSKRATQWLIIVGAAALPQLHQSLTESSTPDEQRFKIMSVLGEIGSARSIGPLIASAGMRDSGGMYRPALFALALLPPTDEAVAFARAQLANGVNQRRQVAGLVYLAQIRHAPSAALVTPFTDVALTPRLRSAGLYLGARLKVPNIVSTIETALLQTSQRSELETLLISLSEATSDINEFSRIATAAGFTETSLSYRQALAYCEFLNAKRDRKKTWAYKVLEDNDIWQRRAAISYLLETDPQGTVEKLTGSVGQLLPLNQLLSLSTTVQLLFSESRRMGLRLEQTAEGYQLKKPSGGGLDSGL